MSNNFAENKGFTNKTTFNVYEFIEDIIMPEIRNNVSDIAICAERIGSPYFFKGTQVEITDELRAIAESGNQLERFPMFALEINDTTRRRDMHPSEGVYFNQTLNLWILFESTYNLNLEDRLVTIYKTIIYPLFEKFTNAIKVNSKYISLEYELAGFSVDDMFNAETPDESVDGVFIPNLNLQIRKTYNNEQ